MAANNNSGLPSIAETLAQRQLDAYNAHDLPSFLACYAPDVRILNLPSGEVAVEGRSNLETRFEAYFRDKKPQAELTHRKVIGEHMVVDEEAVKLGDGTAYSVVAIYEVRDELIQAVWFVRP